MCLLRETVSLDLDPSAAILSVQTQKSQEACSSKVVLQVSSRTLLEGRDAPRPQTCCSQQDVTPWDTWHLFQTAPKPASLHCFHPAQPAPFPLLCSAPSHPGYTWPHHSARAEFLFWLVLWAGSSSDSSGTIQQGKAHREAHNGTDSGGDISGICSVFGLHNAVILQSRCRLTTQLICGQ